MQKVAKGKIRIKFALTVPSLAVGKFSNSHFPGASLKVNYILGCIYNSIVHFFLFVPQLCRLCPVDAHTVALKPVMGK